MKKIRLFCLPYAGGSSLVFSKWKNGLHPSIQLRPVELAGRGRRMSEAYYNNMDEAVADALRIIKFELADVPYAIYGHSLGAMTAYQLAQVLREKQYPQPVHIFFSGRGAPHIRRNGKKPTHTLPPDEFKQKVMELGGTPKEFFEHPELQDILLPLLRADFRVSWSYNHPEEIQPLDYDITVMTGTEEDLQPEHVDEWSKHTRRKCTRHVFDGGHFFLNDPDQQNKILDIINDTLVDLARPRTLMST